jgi:hypothetical protein
MSKRRVLKEMLGGELTEASYSIYWNRWDNKSAWIYTAAEERARVSSFIQEVKSAEERLLKFLKRVMSLAKDAGVQAKVVLNTGQTAIGIAQKPSRLIVLYTKVVFDSAEGMDEVMRGRAQETTDTPKF